MDWWHKLGRIFRLSNLGAFIFVALNISSIILFLIYIELTKEEVLLFFLSYLIVFALAISPIGDFVLSLMIGAKKIKRNDIKIKLYPLFDIVYEKAKDKSPYISKNIKIKIIPNNEEVNAFAVGRRTICVTQGLLQLDDEEIMAVLAHEFGHIAYKHTIIQIIVLCSNFFISGILLLVKLVSWIFAGLSSLVSIFYRSYLFAFVATITAVITSTLVWLWTKFCLLFLRWSMRENEYLADEYAFKLGYGDSLSYVIDNCLANEPSNSFFKVLYSTHPSNNSRIAHLQELGANYNAYI